MRVVDLFAGAGLLSYAFRTRGFDVSLAIERDPRAAHTYRRNLGDHVTCADVRRLAPEHRVKRYVDEEESPASGASSAGGRVPRARARGTASRLPYAPSFAKMLRTR